MMKPLSKRLNLVGLFVLKTAHSDRCIGKVNGSLLPTMNPEEWLSFDNAGEAHRLRHRLMVKGLLLNEVAVIKAAEVAAFDWRWNGRLTRSVTTVNVGGRMRHEAIKVARRAALRELADLELKAVELRSEIAKKKREAKQLERER